MSAWSPNFHRGRRARLRRPGRAPRSGRTRATARCRWRAFRAARRSARAFRRRVHRPPHLRPCRRRCSPPWLKQASGTAPAGTCFVEPPARRGPRSRWSSRPAVARHHPMARDALDALNRARLTPGSAPRSGPTGGPTLVPQAGDRWRAGSGYDTDGRTDIGWWDTLRFRLRMKRCSSPACTARSALPDRDAGGASRRHRDRATRRSLGLPSPALTRQRRAVRPRAHRRPRPRAASRRTARAAVRRRHCRRRRRRPPAGLCVARAGSAATACPRPHPCPAERRPAPQRRSACGSAWTTRRTIARAGAPCSPRSTRRSAPRRAIRSISAPCSASNPRPSA